MGFLGSLFKKKDSAQAPKKNAGAAVRWRVTKVTKETPTTVSVEVDGTLDFKPGQFVLLRPTVDLPWRAYSFSRAPGTPLRLTIKRVPQGVVSTHLTTRLAEGDTLEVKGPYGQFVFPDGFTHAVCVAGGSGITPFLSMLQALQAKGWPAKVTLYDFNRCQEEQILRAELDALVGASGGKLTVVHQLDDAQGLPTAERIEGFLKAHQADVIAMCGPEPLMDLTRACVNTHFPGVKVLEEKFTVAHDVGGSGASHQVEVVMDGKTRSFEVKDGEHVLAAARKAGVELSAGCEMGACGVCRVRVLSGGIEIPEDACLSDGEKAEGYGLVCVGKVKQNTRIEPAP